MVSLLDVTLKYSAHISHPSIHATCLACEIVLHLIIYIILWFEVQITNFLIAQFSPSHIASSQAIIFSSAPYSQTPLAHDLPIMRDTMFHTHKEQKAKYTLHTLIFILLRLIHN